jgi:hypothetical protein
MAMAQFSYILPVRGIFNWISASKISLKNLQTQKLENPPQKSGIQLIEKTSEDK